MCLECGCSDSGCAVCDHGYGDLEHPRVVGCERCFELAAINYVNELDIANLKSGKFWMPEGSMVNDRRATEV